MSNNLNAYARLLSKQLAISAIMVITPLALNAQELGEPRIGAEILPETVQLVHNSRTACALQNAGDVFCWANSVFSGLDTPADEAGFSTLNVTLNNDIRAITLSDNHHCAIGQVSGVACVNLDVSPFNIDFGLDNPPEPDASYLSISDIRGGDANVCGIQTDNRVVCWGFVDSVNDVPPEAAFLQQVDVFSGRACGIDLNNALVCWGDIGRTFTGEDLQFGDVDITSIGAAKQIALGNFGACLIRRRCFSSFMF